MPIKSKLDFRETLSMMKHYHNKKQQKLTDLKREENNSLLMSYMDEGFSQNLMNRQKEIDTRLEKYIFDERR